MIAGTETTATALSGTTYHLLQNPKVLKNLVAEIREAFSDFDDITLEDLARLKYLQAVLQEGLRMYPPVPIALPRRTPKEGSIVCDEWVPGDVAIGVNHFATYRMPEHFKNAYEFHPERWLGDPEYKDDHLDALEPFSVGPRNCLGKNLAWHEMRVLLVTVLLHFDLQLCKDSEDWSDQKVYTLWEKKPLMCSLTPATKA
jgi:cytochrome P450